MNKPFRFIAATLIVATTPQTFSMARLCSRFNARSLVGAQQFLPARLLNRISVIGVSAIGLGLTATAKPAKLEGEKPKLDDPKSALNIDNNVVEKLINSIEMKARTESDLTNMSDKLFLLKHYLETLEFVDKEMAKKSSDLSKAIKILKAEIASISAKIKELTYIQETSEQALVKIILELEKTKNAASLDADYKPIEGIVDGIELKIQTEGAIINCADKVLLLQQQFRMLEFLNREIYVNNAGLDRARNKLREEMTLHNKMISDLNSKREANEHELEQVTLDLEQAIDVVVLDDKDYFKKYQSDKGN